MSRFTEVIVLARNAELVMEPLTGQFRLVGAVAPPDLHVAPRLDRVVRW